MRQLHLTLYVDFISIDPHHTEFLFLSSTFQARDFGPRLFSAFVYGWNDVFRANDYYFWVPIVGPILGGTIGVWVFHCYALIIKNYGQFSNIEHKNSAEVGHKNRKTSDDVLELRQQLTASTD